MHQPNQLTHRAFYGLTFPGSIESVVADLIGQLREQDDGAVRWTPEENLHATLRFLGELPTDIFRRARQVMNEAIFTNTFQVRFTKINGLPSLSRPNVIVLDLEGVTEQDRKALTNLQLETESLARTIGLAPEKRPFHPHLTLGRVRRNRQISSNLRSAMQNLHPIVPDVKIQDILLIESFLSREGAKYRVAEKRSLS